MFNILWPSKTKPDSGVLGRLGRALHWTLTVVAAMFMFMGYADLMTAFNTDPSSEIIMPDGSAPGWSAKEAAAWHRVQGELWLVRGFAAFLLGRICRYVLSGE